MTISNPQISLGLWIPNSTLSVPDTGIAANSQGAAGWERDNAALSLNAADGGPNSYGHMRAQRLSISGTSTTTRRYYSPLTPYGQCVANAAANFFYAVEWYSVSGSGSWRLEHYTYDSSGSQVGSTQTPISAQSSTPSSWTLTTGTLNFTIPASAAYHQLAIRYDNTSSMNRVFRFVGCGLWFDLENSYVLGYMPTHPGTTARRMGMREEFRTAIGGRRYINGQNRWVQPWHIDLAHAIMDDDTHTELSRAHAYNMGRTYQGSDNPGGGQWPILLKTNHSGMPSIGYYDFDSTEEPWNVGTDVYWDPPYWSGVAGLTERIL
ncbi:MAG: hypothetical protein KC729_00145 [Candidatus Eisenbacteria bacterium]|uniref:Uncharacterized protein n=1 Tax=Eiseniibacteriota bacterium TaxID=2212470 RepID=A0A956LUQ5_UNCEI|nr:hypothetical protein [Candidatus Eisenbacteria bacterium]